MAHRLADWPCFDAEHVVVYEVCCEAATFELLFGTVKYCDIVSSFMGMSHVMSIIWSSLLTVSRTREESLSREGRKKCWTSRAHKRHHPGRT